MDTRQTHDTQRVAFYVIYVLRLLVVGTLELLESIEQQAFGLARPGSGLGNPSLY